MTSKEYWSKREREALEHYITEEEEYAKRINEIYQYMLDNINKEINGFYTRYATATGISMADAKKRTTELEIDEYSRKAKQYVKNKDFSANANAEMKLYNLTMKVNRLELLKANIGLEMVDGFNDIEKYFDGILNERTIEELKRQAGILGQSIGDNAKLARIIVNASFNNAKFSDRIWMYQGMLKDELSSLLSTGLIQGKHPYELSRQLQKLFGVQKTYADRLMRTEMCRVQIEAQRQSYDNAGYEQYMFITTHDAKTCYICAPLDGEIYSLKDMQVGENAPPMHPNCRCSTAAYMDRADVEKQIQAMAFADTDIKEESLHTKNDSDYGVNWKTVKSKEYTERFNKLSNNEKANALAAKRARNALRNRDGKNTEEIYAINLTTGKDVSSITNQNYIKGLKRTKKFIEDIKRAEKNGDKILLIHNHPSSSVPSIADINELLSHSNTVGITVGHNGNIYYYSRPSSRISDSDFRVALLKNKSYNTEKQSEDALYELAKQFNFEFSIL